MKPRDYYIKLSPAGRHAYAIAAGTTAKYLRSHVFRAKGPTRTPSNGLIIGLVKASEGNVSLDEAIEYFLSQPVRELFLKNI